MASKATVTRSTFNGMIFEKVVKAVFPVQAGREDQEEKTMIPKLYFVRTQNSEQGKLRVRESEIHRRQGCGVG